MREADRTPFIGPPLTLVLVLFAAGCGGGGSTSSLTKAQFIKRADAICAKADAARLEAISKTSGSTLHILRAAIRPIQMQAEEIAALGAPSGDEDQVAVIVREMEKAVEQAEKGGNANIEKAFVNVDRIARRYGFKECSHTLF